MRSTETVALPLRQKNFARVRLSIMEVTLELSRGRAFDELSIREISERAGISQGTFFNHFPTKQDVLFYFMRHWTLRAALHSQRAFDAGGTAREAMGAIFSLVTEETRRYPQLMLELIAQIARATRPPEIDLSTAERLIAFPGEPTILDLKEPTLDQLFTGCLSAAIEKGELPGSTQMKPAVEVLRALFYGIPIAARGKSAGAVQRSYENALDVVWKGLSASAGREPGPAER